MCARSVAALFLLFLAACGTPETEEPAVDPAAEAATEPAEASSSMAAFAGTWENTVRLEGVEEPIPSTMTGSASGNDWTMSLQERDNIPMQVSIVGDSLIGQSSEYESILRAGVMVTVRTASVLQGDRLVGNVTATYRTPQGEERVPGTIEGRRVQ